MERKRKPWIRYTLRSLLIAITIFGIWLAFRVNRAHNQRRVVAAVRQSGGFVQYDHQHAESYWAMPAAQRPGFRKLHSHIPSRLVMKLRDLIRPHLGTDLVDSVVTVGVRGGDLPPSLNNPQPTRRLTEEEWGYLQRLPSLEEIHISGRVITDEDMPFLSQIPNLRIIIGIANNSITDAGVNHLRQTESLEIIH